jgi:hypothetical protein
MFSTQPWALVTYATVAEAIGINIARKTRSSLPPMGRRESTATEKPTRTGYSLFGSLRLQKFQPDHRRRHAQRWRFGGRRSNIRNDHRGP